MKVGDLVKINVKKMKINGRCVLKSEVENPFGIIVRTQYTYGTRRRSYRVFFTEDGTAHWYSGKYLEVVHG